MMDCIQEPVEMRIGDALPSPRCSDRRVIISRRHKLLPRRGRASLESFRLSSPPQPNPSVASAWKPIEVPSVLERSLQRPPGGKSPPREEQQLPCCLSTSCPDDELLRHASGLPLHPSRSHHANSPVRRHIQWDIAAKWQHSAIGVTPLRQMSSIQRKIRLNAATTSRLLPRHPSRHSVERALLSRARREDIDPLEHVPSAHQRTLEALRAQIDPKTAAGDVALIRRPPSVLPPSRLRLERELQARPSRHANDRSATSFSNLVPEDDLFTRSEVKLLRDIFVHSSSSSAIAKSPAATTVPQRRQRYL